MQTGFQRQNYFIPLANKLIKRGLILAQILDFLGSGINWSLKRMLINITKVHTSTRIKKKIKKERTLTLTVLTNS